ncbi:MULTISPECIES: hypothetical protein [unclassified Streptomyces]|uniref:Uncharacterized protein n=1 Tax=Streptomyces sp. NBC_00060 TaxID=2975636 RepID=A0AAU2H9Z9_9ACTN
MNEPLETPAKRAVGTRTMGAAGKCCLAVTTVTVKDFGLLAALER